MTYPVSTLVLLALAVSVCVAPIEEDPNHESTANKQDEESAHKRGSGNNAPRQTTAGKDDDGRPTRDQREDQKKEDTRPRQDQREDQKKDEPEGEFKEKNPETETAVETTAEPTTTTVVTTAEPTTTNEPTTALKTTTRPTPGPPTIQALPIKMVDDVPSVVQCGALCKRNRHCTSLTFSKAKTCVLYSTKLPPDNLGGGVMKYHYYGTGGQDPAIQKLVIFVATTYSEKRTEETTTPKPEYEDGEEKSEEVKPFAPSGM